MSDLNIIDNQRSNSHENILKNYYESSMSGGALSNYYNNSNIINEYTNYYANKLLKNDEISRKTIDLYGNKLIKKISRGGIAINSSIISNYANDIKTKLEKLKKPVANKVLKHINDLSSLATKFKDENDKLVDKVTYNLNNQKEKLKKLTKGGTSELDSPFYSPSLTEDELNLLKNDYMKIIRNIKKIDKSLQNIIKEVNDNNLSKYNKKFKDLIIRRRILMESVKDLEMKYNSVISDDGRLDYAIDLIRKDKERTWKK
jgi:hypothetical protein